MKQLIQKDIEKQKKEFIDFQDGKCAVCNQELDKDLSKVHLDHDHDLEGVNAGKCRGALCMFCNRLEGELKKKFIHSGLDSRGVDQLEWLTSLVSYLNVDLSDRNIHPQFINDYVKSVCKQPKYVIIEELRKIGVNIPEKADKKELAKLFRKEFRKYQKQTFNEYNEVQ